MKKHSILKDCDELTIWLANGLVVKGYYTCCRVKPEEVPAGMFKYDIREDDEGNGDMISLEPFVWVNHHGTFITAMPIDFKDCLKDWIGISEWDFSPWSE